MLINPALVSHVSWWFMWPKKVLWLSPTKLLISGSFTYLQIQWLYQWESLRSHSWLTHTPSVVLTPSHPFFPFPDQSTSLCLGVHEFSSLVHQHTVPACQPTAPPTFSPGSSTWWNPQACSVCLGTNPHVPACPHWHQPHPPITLKAHTPRTLRPWLKGWQQKPEK